jgi:site-specific recombinase XerD
MSERQKHIDVDEWLDWMLNVRHRRGSTLTGYRQTMHEFVRWTGDRMWGDITPKEVEGFMTRVRSNGEVGAASTQDRDRHGIKSFYGWAVPSGVARSSPMLMVHPVNGRKRTPKAIDDELWRKVWLSRIADEDRVWLGLGAFAGLRRREMVVLGPTQVHMDREMIFGLERKGGGQDVVEFGQMARVIADRFPSLLPDVDRWLAMVADLVEERQDMRVLVTHDEPASESERFQHTLPAGVPTPAVINRELVKILKRAGMPPHIFSPHALRHTACTNLLRAGVPLEVVSDALGHSDITITMRYVKSAGRLAEWRSSFQ